MKVLQINTEKTWRGGERQTIYSIEGLLAAGVEVGLLCRAGCPLAKAAAELDVTLHAFSGQAGALAWLCGPGPRRYDLLHSQSAKGQSLAVLARAFHRRPHLYTRRVNFLPRGAATRLKYRLTGRTVAISRAIADTLMGFGVPNVEVISSTFREKELNKLRAADFADEQGLIGKHIIASTGDMVPQKDPATMVETVGELRKLRDDFVFLHFGNTQMLDQLRPRIEALGLADCYRVLGHVDDVEDFFLLFDAFLITSDETEGLCSSVYDAFIYRVPLVSTLCGGMFDSVADRGLTCGPREPACLARQLSRLLDDTVLAQELGGRAHAWVKANVGIPAVTERYLDVYESMIGGDHV